MTHVPYRATPLSVSSVISGETVMSFASVSVAQETVKSGRLRGLGVTSNKRVLAWPEMPTIDEAGLPGFDVAAWFGFSATGGTNPEIIRRLNSEFRHYTPPERQLPVVSLRPFGDAEYFPAGVKHRYTRRS